jgi:hypothetical protein
MPDNAASAIELAIFETCLSRGEPLNGTLHRSVLLVAPEDLDGAALDRHMEGKISNDVE